MAKTNTGLVEYAKAQLGKPYWYGTFGNTSTVKLYETKKKQYPQQYQWSCPADQLNKRVHDCVGLIKGYLWSESPTATPKYDAKQDVSANGMLQACKEKGAISTMPELPGVLVFLPGHVGVYIGDGYVIEAKGHAYGVVKTKLADRGWKNWGKCPWINYTQNDVTQNTVKPAETAKKATQQWVPAIGDTVTYTGSVHYVSSNSLVPKKCKGGRAKITAIYRPGKARHPYHLTHTGGGSTVCGWVDEGTFKKA